MRASSCIPFPSSSPPFGLLCPSQGDASAGKSFWLAQPFLSALFQELLRAMNSPNGDAELLVPVQLLGTAFPGQGCCDVEPGTAVLGAAQGCAMLPRGPGHEGHRALQCHSSSQHRWAGSSRAAVSLLLPTGSAPGLKVFHVFHL